ncbi:MAG: formylglycine-generating enzyme family protein [Leptothrix ochracea]|uniref:formylglycine-generating enzyme family protein n=1 Tax=Leptothrix ochracea TaxID=735331 RepID=UPI0034E2A2DA
MNKSPFEPARVAGWFAGLLLSLCAAGASAQAVYGAGSVMKDCTDCPEMVVLPKGHFLMGAPDSEAGRKPNEVPQHDVGISVNIAMSRFELQKGEFARFVDDAGYKTEAETGDGCWLWQNGELNKGAGTSWRNPGFEQDDHHPVVCVSWNDAQAYVKWLSQKTSKTYRLPSEAEWEFAARARSTTRYSFGSEDARLADFAWFTKVSEGHTHAVGEKKPNGFGLFDVHGNAWEWTQDCWHDTYINAPTDGNAWDDPVCQRRVFRGGSWGESPRLTRTAARVAIAPSNRGNFVGMRIVRAMP